MHGERMEQNGTWPELKDMKISSSLSSLQMSRPDTPGFWPWKTWPVSICSSIPDIIRFFLQQIHLRDMQRSWSCMSIMNRLMLVSSKTRPIQYLKHIFLPVLNGRYLWPSQEKGPTLIYLSRKGRICLAHMKNFPITRPMNARTAGRRG